MSICIGQICGENRLRTMDKFVAAHKGKERLKIAKGKKRAHPLFLKAPSFFGLHSERLSAAQSAVLGSS